MDKEGSLNPFRMSGSYIGLFTGFVLGYLSFNTISILCKFGSCKVTAYLIPFLFVMIGFLVGWGVHGLIRKK